jgi:1-acyl-sn-glycerol-3-phosphate acyltransferase
MSVPHISPPVLGFFRRIVSGYFRRHFRAVRIAEGIRLSSITPGTPLIVFANHSSWWDPMVCVLLAHRLLPRRRHFAPMDAAALERYAILKRVGIFPVEMKTARGAAQFLRTGLDLLTDDAVLWITPQGRFADPRESPLVFKPGLAKLAHRAGPDCLVLPLAIEYTFWDERLPETLLEFGAPIRVGENSLEALALQLPKALQAAQDSLREKAMARNPLRFDLLSEGTAGTGGWYGLGKRLLSRLTRQPYQPDHTPHSALLPVNTLKSNEDVI